ncbi:MAG: CoA transferase subunit A [Sporomusaceae bacterium]|nr:CoA transferase subunit A [Sporomusaceae bacterium]
MNKVMNLDEVIEKVCDGATIMIGGFLGIGSPLKCIEKLVEKKVKDLTVIAVVCSYPGGDFDLAPLFKNKQVKKFITAHAGTCPEALEVFKNGELEIEYYPMGSFIEKIRAGGSGLGGVLTPTGNGTLVAEGKEKLTINGKEYLLELPLTADFAFIKGYRADKLGNVQYRGVSLNSNPVMATAATFTVAEVNEIVEVGGINPELVGTPGIFVKAVIQGDSLQEQQDVLKELWVRTGRLA